jgi:hypothetical protein
MESALCTGGGGGDERLLRLFVPQNLGSGAFKIMFENREINLHF